LQGQAEAQTFLGAMYAHGRGVTQDGVEAVKWYKLAAAQGDANAQFNLGAMYDNGLGVKQDDVEAVKWSNLAAAQGDADVVKNRDIVARKMSQQQLEEAQKLSRECLARKYEGC
jgi:TPR repeat protein